MDILLAAVKQLNVIIASLLVVYGWSIFKGAQLRILFLGMMLSFTVSTVLFFPEGEIDEWLKHAPFYAGQLLYFFFMMQISLTSSNNRPKDLKKSMPIGIFLGGMGTIKSQVLAERGIQHILAAPIFLIVALVMLLRVFSLSSRTLQVVIGYFLVAGASLSMIHVAEYMVETRGLLPVIHGEAIELIELVWFYLACSLFALGLRKYKKLCFKEVRLDNA